MIRRLLILVVLAVLPACADSGLEPGEGFVDVTGGRVWYRIVGSGTATPVILLHGGPGAPSYYLKPLEALAADRPVLFYDQLGGGRSDRPTADSALPSLKPTPRTVKITLSRPPSSRSIGGWNAHLIAIAVLIESTRQHYVESRLPI